MFSGGSKGNIGKKRVNIILLRVNNFDIIQNMTCNIWDKVFKNEPNKICGRQPSKNLE